MSLKNPGRSTEVHRGHLTQIFNASKTKFLQRVSYRLREDDIFCEVWVVCNVVRDGTRVRDYFYSGRVLIEYSEISIIIRVTDYRRLQTGTISPLAETTLKLPEIWRVAEQSSLFYARYARRLVASSVHFIIASTKRCRFASYALSSIQ